MFRVIHFLRKPLRDAHSIERLFADVRSHLPSDMQSKTAVSKYPSVGLFKRLYNIIQAYFYQDDVNHVTGEVHFLTYLLNRQKTILTILDCVMMERLHGIRRWIFWLFWLWLPEKRCSVITVISEATRQQVLNYLHCDPAKVKVIYCNVSDDFKFVAKKFNQDCPQILQVGTFPNKNIERVVVALAGLPCKLVIIGFLSKAHLELLQQYQVKFENFENLPRDALVAQYEACDLVIFASTYEGFGLPIVEANAVGRPVITSNICSMPEVAGDAACLVDPLDVADIRAAVLRVINDKVYRDQLVANGLENVKRFQIETIAAQYADLYRAIYMESKLKGLS